MSFIKTYGGPGLAAVNRARSAGLSDLQIIAIGQREGFSWGPKAQSSLLASAQQSQNSAISSFESRLNQQAAQYQQQTRAMQNQMRQQQAAYKQQLQLTENAQRAYVPQAENTAQEKQPTQPQAPGAGRRRLSSLAIIEGLGTNANPLSGLQLA